MHLAIESHSFTTEERLRTITSATTSSLFKNLFILNNRYRFDVISSSPSKSESGSFSLGKKNPEKIDLKEGVIYTKKKISGLTNTLAHWYGEQNEYLQKQGYTPIHLACGFLTYNRRRFPILYLPLVLSPDPDRPFFTVSHFGSDYVFSLTFLSIAEQLDLDLPELPAIQENLELNTFFNQVSEKLPQDSTTQLLKKHELQLAFRQADHETGQQEKTQEIPFISFNSRFTNENNWLNLVQENPFVTAKHHLQILSDYKKNLNQIIKRPESGLSDHRALQMLLIQAMKDGNKTLLISDDGIGTENVYQFLKMQKLDHAVLNYFHTPDRFSLCQNIKQKFNFGEIDSQISIKEINKQECNPILTHEKKLQSSIGSTNLTYIDLLIKLEEFNDLPALSFRFDTPDDLEQQTLKSWKSNITDYLNLKDKFRDISSFAWNDLTTEATIDGAGIVNIKRMLQKLDDLLFQIKKESDAIASKTGLPEPQTLNESKLLTKHLSFFLDHPSLYEQQLDIDWSPIPERVHELLSLLERTQKSRKKTKEFFNTEIIHEPLENLIPRLRKISLNFTRFFNWSYKKDVQRLSNYAKEKTGDQDIEFWRYLSEARVYQKLRDELNENSEYGSFYFGDFWQGANTNLEFCHKQSEWLKTFTDYCEKYSIPITPELKKLVSGNKKFDPNRIDMLTNRLQLFDNTVSVIKEFLPFNEDSIFNVFDEINWNKLYENIQKRSDEILHLTDWIELKSMQENTDFSELDDLLDEFRDRDDISTEQLPQVITKCFYESLFEETKIDFEKSAVTSIKEKATDFSDILAHNKLAITNQVSHKLKKEKNDFIRSDDFEASKQQLQFELLKKNSHLSFSEIIKQTKEAILAYTPLWIIPSSRLDIFEDHIGDFDTIIIDEVEDMDGNFWNNIGVDQQLIGLSSSKVNSIPYPEANQYPLFYTGSNHQDAPERKLKLPTLSIKQVNIGEQDKDDSLVPDKIIKNTMGRQSDKSTNYKFWFSNKNHRVNFWLKYARLYSRESDSTPENLLNEIHKYPHVLSLTDIIHNSGQASHSFIFNISDDKEKDTGFGFKKTTRNNHSFQSVIETTLSKITLFESSDRQKQDKHLLKKLENQVYSKRNLYSHFQSVLSDRISNTWQVIGHPENPYEALLLHKTKNDLKIYICSDTSSYFQEQPLLLNYTLATQVFNNVLYFPLRYYPDKMNEWFEEAQKQIKEVEKELFKGKHGLKRKSKKKNSHQREIKKQPELITPDWMPTYSLRDEIEFQKSEDQVSSVKPEIEQLPNLNVYEYCDRVIIGSEQDFATFSDKDLKPLLLDLVKQEAPIHWRNTVRRVLSYWQIFDAEFKYGNRILDIIERLYKDEIIFLKDECIYNDDSFKFALRDRSNNPGLHRAEEIPLDECETAIFEILKVFSPVEKDLLLTTAAQYMGFKNATTTLLEQYEIALLRMADDGYITQSPNGILLSEKLSDIQEG